MPTVTENVKVGAPFEPKRGRVGASGKPAKPWLVVLRRGETFSLIEHHWFHEREDAEAFYREHTT